MLGVGRCRSAQGARITERALERRRHLDGRISLVAVSCARADACARLRSSSRCRGKPLTGTGGHVGDCSRHPQIVAIPHSIRAPASRPDVRGGAGPLSGTRSRPPTPIGPVPDDRRYAHGQLGVGTVNTVSYCNYNYLQIGTLRSFPLNLLSQFATGFYAGAKNTVQATDRPIVSQWVRRSRISAARRPCSERAEWPVLLVEARVSPGRRAGQ